jgi:hypothetical protein
MEAGPRPRSYCDRPWFTLPCVMLQQRLRYVSHLSCQEVRRERPGLLYLCIRLWEQSTACLAAQLRSTRSTRLSRCRWGAGCLIAAVAVGLLLPRLLLLVRLVRKVFTGIARCCCCWHGSIRQGERADHLDRRRPATAAAALAGLLRVRRRVQPLLRVGGALERGQALLARRRVVVVLARLDDLAQQQQLALRKALQAHQGPHSDERQGGSATVTFRASSRHMRAALKRTAG